MFFFNFLSIKIKKIHSKFKSEQSDFRIEKKFYEEGARVIPKLKKEELKKFLISFLFVWLDDLFISIFLAVLVIILLKNAYHDLEALDLYHTRRIKKASYSSPLFFRIKCIILLFKCTIIFILILISILFYINAFYKKMLPNHCTPLDYIL